MNFKIDASYIRGFADADGTCNGNMVSICNTRKDLLMEMMFSLRDMGIHSGIYTNKEIIISKITKKPHKQAHRLTISGVYDLAKYAVYVGFNLDYKMEKLVGYIKSQCVDVKPGNLDTYYRYLEMKSKGFGVTKMARLFGVRLNTMQWRIKNIYPLDDEIIKALKPFQPQESKI